MSAPGLVLATDLDGTFLGGSDGQRRALYDHLERRDDGVLVFVTGRDLGFIRDLVADGDVPRPDWIVGDVGTTVADGRDFRPVEAIEQAIADRWNDAGDRVRAMLAGEPGLRLQSTAFRYRVSYDCDPAALSPGVAGRIEAAGFDCLLSADRFLDVLPRGVAKGPTLLRLVEWLGLPTDRVLVAGDTLNDLSLFQTRLKGVAVGNSEPKLLDAVTGFDWVHRSSQPGAAGISDALRHFGLQ